jgi:protein-tyrosine phosphatase
VAGYLDLHAHVLPGVDDGPRDLAGSLALLQALVADGVETVWATPHVQPMGFTTTVQLRDARLSMLRPAAASAGIAIGIEPGGEIDLEYAAAWPDADLDRFALGERVLLIEFPWGGAWPSRLAPTCRALRERGYLPIVAHPERAYAVQQDPDRMAEATAAGAVGQLTAASVSGRLGDSAQQTSFALIERGTVHLVASDAHNTAGRAPDFAGAANVLAASYGDDFADAILQAAREVVCGRVPQLPAPPKRRRLPA